MTRLSLFAVLVMLLSGGCLVGASAQTPPTGAEATKPDGSRDPSGNLSEKLNRTDGVIVPQGNVDPDIHKPAPEPNPGSTPVIPPPGSPGGRQDIDPK